MLQAVSFAVALEEVNSSKKKNHEVIATSWTEETRITSAVYDIKWCYI